MSHATQGGADPKRAFPVTKHTSNGHRMEFMHVPASIVEEMKSSRARNNKISIMELFGISDNSWRRIRCGSPLRYSVAMRLIERLRTQRHLALDRNPE